MEGSDVKDQKSNLSLGQAAFLLLRVRKVFKKKLAKKDKSSAQDPKTEFTSSFKRKKSGKFPLIRSRTVPAIIVPFSILQAQVHNSKLVALNNETPNVQQTKDKSDYAQHGVDYVQFLVSNSGSSLMPSPCTPPIGKRDFSGNASISFGESSTPTPLLNSPNSQTSGTRGLGGRLSRLLITPNADHRKFSTFSQQQQDMFKWNQDPGGDGHFCSPRSRKRRSLEYEDVNIYRPRAESIDTIIRNKMSTLAPGKENFNKRFSTCSAGPQVATKQDLRHQEGLIIAVENGNTTKAKKLLVTTDADVNSIATDNFTLLEIASIQRNHAMVKILLEHGATENRYRNESIEEQLNNMVYESEKKSQDLMASILKASTFGNLSPNQLKELEKEFHFWEKRNKRFRDMKNEYSKIRPPDPPSSATLEVIGATSVRIRFQESPGPNNSICTKYKIEWSQYENFPPNDPSTRQMEIVDLRKFETLLTEFTSGLRLYFRISLGNCKGYGEYANTTPFSVIPSTWRDIDGRKGRYLGKSGIFEQISSQVIISKKPENTPEMKSAYLSGKCGVDVPSPASNLQKKNQKIISIKQLFAGAPKFQKNLKRGVFLVCIIYSEDKLLMTSEEFLPAIEIDEDFPSSLNNDFHWLLKVSWEDVKRFRQDMEKSGSASAFHFRLKLLQAVFNMQNALGIVDLGHLYYKTMKDKKNGVAAISTIKYMRSTKHISSLNVRWVPISKVGGKKSNEDFSDSLTNSIQDQILYHQVSNIPLTKGLYLGYLRLSSSVDSLKVLVSKKTPNFLPHSKIRDNPNVSSEEWMFIQKIIKSKSLDSLNFVAEEENTALGISSSEDGNSISPSVEFSNLPPLEERESPLNPNSGGGGGEPTTGLTAFNNSAMCKLVTNSSKLSLNPCEFSEAQELFRSQLITALRKLFSYLEIDFDSGMKHRLCNSEVVEVSPNVALLIVYPPIEHVCLVAGQSDKLAGQRSDLISLPIQVFEMIHLTTYQKDLISRYARLSSVLEMDTILAQHYQREAFSNSELVSAKERLKQLQELQSQIDANWKTSRWIIDIVTLARDKLAESVSIRAIFQSELSVSSESILSADALMRRSEELQLNQLFVKSPISPGSGSDGFQGIGQGLKFSKSENQLALGTSKQEFFNRSPQPFKREPPVSKIRSKDRVGVGGGSGRGSDEDFSPKIYSYHSQSDSKLATGVVTEEQLCSTSMQNIYHDISSSSVGSITSDPPPPSIVIVPETSTGPEESKMIVKIPVSTTLSAPGPTKPRSTEPPPVPPRRTIPPVANTLISKPQPETELVTTPTSSFILDLQLGSFGIEPPQTLSKSIIQVYAAYESGLAEQTSLRIQITSQTTAREVVDMFVKKLNAERIERGIPAPLYETTQDFCIVCVIGERERMIRNDFRLHLIQQTPPWRDGRLFVRKKIDITSAININTRIDKSIAQ